MKEFEISIDQNQIKGLQRRIKNTRWIKESGIVESSLNIDDLSPLLITG